MKVLVRAEEGTGDSVQESLMATGWPFTGDAPSFQVATGEEAINAGSVTFVVTDDASKVDSYPDAARVFVWTGDQLALTRELRSAILLVRKVCHASPYRRLLDECPMPIVVRSADGSVLYENGASRAEPARHAIVPSLPPQRLDAAGVTEQVEEWHRPISDSDPPDTFVMPRQHGFRRTTTARTQLGDGTQIVMDVSADVSKDHAVREELSQELALMRGLLDSMPSLVLVTDDDDCIVMLNPTLSRLFSTEREHLVGANMCSLMAPEALEIWRVACAKARETGREVPYESEATLPDGTQITYNGTTQATLGPSGRSWIMTVAVDVSELRRAKREAESATIAAMEASRVKSQFLANMSHEIRTPMNGVLGMLQLALGTELTSDQREYLEAAHSSADSLLTIINDILDISKIEAGKLTLETIPFSVANVARGLATLTSRAQEKGLTTSIEVAPEVPDHVLGDPVRLRQILVNLFGNAIKFTETGSVDVRVFLDDARTSQLHVTVKDSGIGIPPEQLAHIFDAFSQADGTTTRRFGGTGLGLSICRELVTLMGGRLWVESEAGRGSTFHFTARLPEAAAPASETRLGAAKSANPAPLARAPRSLRVLIAEDNPVGAKVAVRILELFGCTPFHVSNGQQAFEAAKTHPFDLILMDMQMPVMDGLEATGKIRAWEQAQGKKRIPIVALTANAMKGDAEMCVAAGMDGHLAKPIERDLLRRVIDDVGNRRETVAPTPPVVTRPVAVDLAKALELCGDDPELLLEVAEAFKVSVRDNCATLDLAMGAHDPAMVHKAAHALKGVFVYVCAGRAAAIAQEICTKAKQADLSTVPELIRALVDECAAVSAVLATVRQAPAA